METLIFVTGNKEKLNIAKEALKNTGINIINSSKYASDKLKCNVVKVDSGLFLEAFDGFPRTIF